MDNVNAVGSLCSKDPHCYEGIPCPHHVEVLREVRTYFADRADAEYSTESPTPTPNEEMRLLVLIDDALRARSTATGEVG